MPRLATFALVFSAIVLALWLVMPLLWHWSAVPGLFCGSALWGLLAPSTVRPFKNLDAVGMS
ncbi:MAG: hypothetical protein CM1200mP18_21390 [Gammaproteobacteria bacterium]|nr:MAG: hypothetical protein CM1200mP18_21390 [Gammaproteobacteria bacterium]